MRDSHTLFTWKVAVTKTAAVHTLKAGVWAERARSFRGEDGNFSGRFDFSRDVNNPIDANHPYANALLGSFNSYTESTSRLGADARSTLVEWFARGRGVCAGKVQRGTTGDADSATRAG